MTMPYSAYIAADRCAALAQGVALPQVMHGAALFADISGFSPLTRVLAETLGAQRGAEELTSHLNAIYGALIAEIDRHNGSVISFSGDALLCWFDGDDGSIAAACAFAMQAVMRAMSDVVVAADTHVRFALKTSVAAGQVNRFVVGDPDIQLLDVLAGNLVDVLAAADSVAQAGDVVLDEATAARLQARTDLGALRLDAQRHRYHVIQSLDFAAVHAEPRPAMDLSPEQARPWLLAPIFDRLSRGQGDYLAELRPAVALFARFGLADMPDPASALNALDDFTRDVQRSLTRYEGVLLQVTLGEKGNFLFVVFGAPVAHEDDAIRAVAVAKAIHALEPQHPAIRAIQIGISHGRMRVGAYGGLTRRTYGVMGNEVNIAARLMEKALPGQTLVTESVAAALNERWRVSAAGDFDLKGQAKSVTAFLIAQSVEPGAAPGGEGRESLAGPRLVGRRMELAALLDAIQEISAERARCIAVTGDAGIGKSRLVAHAAAHARERGIPVAVGLGDQVEQDTPYYAWRSILRTLLALRPDDDAAAVRACVHAWCAGDAAILDRLPLLNGLLLIGLDETDLTRAMVGDVRADNTREVVIALLNRVMQAQPAVIIVEDAHWLDSASWQLLNAVHAQVAPAVIMLCARPMQSSASEVLRDEFERLLEHPRTQWIALQPLSAGDMVQLACDQLGVTVLPKPVVDFIDARADGNPLFCEEIVHALRETGRIRVVNGVCELQPGTRDLTGLDFPDTIQEIVISRLDRLPADQQLTLKVASVLGRSFTTRALHDVYPVPIAIAELQLHLEALCAPGVALRESFEPDRRYVFNHNVTLEVAYGTMLFAQRRALHRAAGAWFERAYASDLAPAYSLLAHHWRLAAGDASDDAVAVGKAVKYLELGGDQAASNSAYREAVALYVQLLDVAGSPARAGVPQPQMDRARWQAKLGMAYRGWGRFTDSMIALREAVALYGEPLPVQSPSLVAKLLREVAQQAHTRARPARYAGAAPADVAPRLQSEAKANQYLAEMLFFDNKPLASLYASVRMLNVSERVGSSAELAEAYGAVSLLTGVVGLGRVADAYHARALDVARALDQPAVLADVLRIDGLYRLGIAQFRRSEANLAQALEIAERLRDKRHTGDCLTLLAHIAFLRGEFAASAAQSAELVELGRRDDNPTLLVWGLFLSASNALRLGKIDEALRLANEATEQADAGARIYAAGTLALARWHSGDQAGAAALANDVSALIQKSRGAPAAYNVHAGYVACAEVALLNLSLSRSADRVHATRQACQHLRAYARLFPLGRPAASFYAGLLAAGEGRLGEAQRLWRKSADQAERYNMPYERARALLELGRRARHSDMRAASALAQATQIFESLRTPLELSWAWQAASQPTPRVLTP